MGTSKRIWYLNLEKIVNDSERKPKAITVCKHFFQNFFSEMHPRVWIENSTVYISLTALIPNKIYWHTQHHITTTKCYTLIAK